MRADQESWTNQGLLVYNIKLAIKYYDGFGLDLAWLQDKLVLFEKHWTSIIW